MDDDDKEFEQLAVIFESSSLEDGKVGCAFMTTHQWRDFESHLIPCGRRMVDLGIWKGGHHLMFIGSVEIKTVNVAIIDQDKFKGRGFHAFVERPGLYYDDHHDLNLSDVQEIYSLPIISLERGDEIAAGIDALDGASYG